MVGNNLDCPHSKTQKIKSLPYIAPLKYKYSALRTKISNYTTTCVKPFLFTLRRCICLYYNEKKEIKGSRTQKNDRHNLYQGFLTLLGDIQKQPRALHKHSFSF